MTLPVTVVEVEAMFREVLPNGLVPDAETCALMAKLLTTHVGLFTGEHARDPEVKRIKDAVSLLLRECERFRVEMDGAPGGVWWEWPAIQKLDTALREAQHLLVLPGELPPRAPPWFVMVILVSTAARGILKQLGVDSACHRDSALTKFTASALQRMGFYGATPGAVAMQLYRLPTRQRTQ